MAEEVLYKEMEKEKIGIFFPSSFQEGEEEKERRYFSLESFYLYFVTNEPVEESVYRKFLR